MPVMASSSASGRSRSCGSGATGPAAFFLAAMMKLREEGGALGSRGRWGRVGRPMILSRAPATESVTKVRPGERSRAEAGASSSM